jgi:hypothetical protein
MIVYEPYQQDTCGTCDGKLTRGGDCLDCDGESTGCDSLFCAHDHCCNCGALLNTINCTPDETQHAVEPDARIAWSCVPCATMAITTPAARALAGHLATCTTCELDTAGDVERACPEGERLVGEGA